MTRIRQFAKDMSISYNDAKKLVDKGKKRKDGGSNILEGYMPIYFEGMGDIQKKKKKKVPMPKPRPKNLKKKDPFRADKTESLDREFSKSVAKQNERNMKNVKKKDGGTSMRKPRKGENLPRGKLTDMEKAIKKIKTQIDMIPINLHKNVVKKRDGGIEYGDVPGGKAIRQRAGEKHGDIPGGRAKKKKKPESLKPIPAGSKGKGLSKLPTSVRNNMGFKKKGGTMKMRGGGMAIQGTGFRGVR